VNVPGPWEATILALGIYRFWRLFAEDTILDGPRKWLVGLGYRWADGDPLPTRYREKWSVFIECPWCSGAWMTIGIFLLWVWFPTEVLVVCSVAALSTAVGLIRKNLDPPEE
jgi:uncharacterized protein DUF1360